MGDPGLQCFKAGLEVGQVMPQPDRADAGGRDKDTLLAQLVGGPGLTIGRKLQRGFDHCLLGGFVDAVGKIGFAPDTLEQSLHAAFLNCGLVSVKGVARHAHDLAGLRNVAQFLGQIQQSSFVFDDLIGSIQHRGVLVLWLVCTTIKTDNHNLFQEMRRSHSSSLGRERCQITSRLIQLRSPGRELVCTFPCGQYQLIFGADASVFRLQVRLC